MLNVELFFLRESISYNYLKRTRLQKRSAGLGRRKIPESIGEAIFWE